MFKLLNFRQSPVNNKNARRFKTFGTVYNYNNQIFNLRGRVQFPIGGTAHEPVWVERLSSLGKRA